MNTELNNCLEEANDKRRALNYLGETAIAAVLEAGRFAIVSEYPYHCKSTDAFAGNVRFLVTHFPTREEANNYLADLYKSLEASGFLGEERYTVLPRVQNPPSVPWDFNPEVPF